jgi:formate dehydrogenase maturation protein FdhE
LSAEESAAADVLRFAAGLYQAQARLARALEAKSLSGRLEDDLGAIFDDSRNLLGFLTRSAPGALAERAMGRIQEERELFATRLLVFWREGLATADDYLSRCLLRPYAEVLRAKGKSPDRTHDSGLCPFCGGRPWIASRRPSAEAALRMLGCSLCGGEWPFGRVLCPCCFEQDPARLPTFQTDRYPAARVEACETCHRYVKSIDLTLDARAIPEVDDLLSWSLDLWAAEEGFRRVEPGLAGC